MMSAWLAATTRRATAALAVLAASPAAALGAPGLRLRGQPIAVRRQDFRGPRGSSVRLLRLTAPTSRTAAAMQVWLSLADVVAGRLAFVGPRPRALDERIAPEAVDAVLGVPPGLISLSSVRSRALVDFDDEDATDADYARRQSMRGDLGIVARGLLAGLYGTPGERIPVATQFFGIRHLNLAMAELLDLFAVALRTGHRARIAFVNPDCVNLAHRNPIYRAVLGRFDWVLTDGIGMRIAGRMLGQSVRQNVNGTDLFPRLCELLEKEGRSLYLLGGQPGIAEAVADWVRARHPRLRIAGCHHGFFAPDAEAGLVRSIRASRADVLLVGFGAPRQERWIAAHGDACGATLTFGVGGLFDYYSGRIPRAPQWLRELGGEWVFRLVQEPRRLWKRYLVGNFVFLARVLRARSS